MLGSFQSQGLLLLWHIVGQGPTVLAAGAVWMGCFFGGGGLCVCFFFIFFLHLVYSVFPFLMPHLFGNDWTC